MISVAFAGKYSGTSEVHGSPDRAVRAGGRVRVGVESREGLICFGGTEKPSRLLCQ